MSETTNIAWCDSTFNPWEGCSKISPGCDSCYAEARNQRFHGGVNWGPGAPRRRTSASNWAKPLAWNRKARESGKPWRVFCASLADVFDNEVPEAWRNELWALIAATPYLTWMLLTKRIGRWAGSVPDAWLEGFPQNVWLGATVVNQEEADRDAPKLLAVPAAVRFLSIEPMLGPIRLGTCWCKRHRLDGSGLDWVIVGGESNQPGHRARPFRVGWARSIVRQCKAVGVPVFVKQMGSFVIDRNDAGFDGCDPSAWPDGSDDKVEHDIYGVQEKYQGADVRVRLLDRAGGDPAEWPEDLRVREFPR